MADLLLHHKKGVNPRLGICQNCGKDIGVVLVGAKEFVNECAPCKVMVYGGGPCPYCRTQTTRVRMLADNEKIPMGLCDECKKAKAECDAEVAAGGVIWKCEACGSNGAIKAGVDLAVEVRAKLGIAAPAPCGVMVPDCPVCKPPKEDDDQPPPV